MNEPVRNQSGGVSVVMSVYDCEDHVQRTIDSVLEQKDIEFELIVVDDGANSAVKGRLSDYRSEPKVVILEQENQGLTRALINGCESARFDYIARIDAGDTMDQYRLSRQAKALDTHTKAGLVCSWVTMITEEGYFLYHIKPDEMELRSAACSQQLENISTPFHSSVMFRKDLYQQAGGYRPDFYFTQDCDLWSRMAPLCDFLVIPLFLTTGLFSQNGISGRHAASQRQLTRLVVEANKLRAQGKDDVLILEKAKKIRPDQTSKPETLPQSDFPTLYFLASCLSANRSNYARLYWRRAIGSNPFSVKSWVNFFISLFYWRDA